MVLGRQEKWERKGKSRKKKLKLCAQSVKYFFIAFLELHPTVPDFGHNNGFPRDALTK